MKKETRRHVEVLCMTYGEPASNDWVPQYKYSLSILNRLTRRVAPIPRFVTPLLAARRGLIRSKTFNKMGYHSPLDKISEEQARKIGEALRRKRPDIDFRTRMVMEFCDPYIWEHLDEIRRDRPDELVILPLYLAESDYTTGISRTDLANYHRRTEGRHRLPKPAYVDGFGFDERLGKLLADFVWRHCEEAGWSRERCANAALIMGAHGTLQYPPEGTNSGAKETLTMFGLIRRHLVGRFRTIRPAWLNHTLGGKWTFPAADEAAAECWEQGIRDVVYFPYGFFGDNNESENEGRDALAEFKWDNLLYLPCPNDDEAFCGHLADRVLERLDNPQREAWAMIERGGRRDLIQKERPAIKGGEGALSFNAPVLAIAGFLFWATAGICLSIRGIITAGAVESGIGLFLAGLLAVLIGWYKGGRIIGNVVTRNLRRLRRLPQPSPIWKMFSTPLWIAIIFFTALGISLRFMGLPAGLHAAILLGVGLSLLYGTAIGVANRHEAVPRGVLSLDALKRRPKRRIQPPAPAVTRGSA